MRRSKLQVNIDVLKTLANHGKMISTHITYNTFLNNKSVNESLIFLEENKLVQELGKKKRKIYVITDLGLEALDLAKKIDDSFQVFNELNS